jgi:acyl-CoA reductase-like NAD-dependent aldehyde dehydrogenase
MPYEFPVFINGKLLKTNDVLEVKSPYDGQLVGRTYRCGADEIEMAVDAATRAFSQTKNMPIYEKAEKLSLIVEGLKKNKEEFAQILCAEAGKPIKTARSEAERAILTFTDAAEECKRIRGEQVDLDFEPNSKGRWGIIKRFPIGPILGISPFNFPLNLVCHKIAPALAAGNTFILKPASQTPLSALRLAEEISRAGWPDGTINVLPMDSKNAHIMLEDERIKMLTFTGSPEIGWQLKHKVGRKRITLELGGNAGVIIHHDADLDYASSRCTYGGFTQAGQNCISVQRIFLHEKIYNRFMDLFIKKVKTLVTGDPGDEDTDVGPLIHHNEIERIQSWLTEATADGAEILVGGKGKGTLFYPTVVTNVNPKHKISCKEVFAPVVVVYKYNDIEDALTQLNDSDYGLQAGIFTNDIKIIFRAYDKLDVGGVIAGDIPTYRIDPMPYGGTKLSGLGREGVRFAIEEMTELKLLVVNI